MDSQEQINFSMKLNAGKLPDSPGVYFFLGKNKEILYIGKATSLKDRVRSYFGADLIATRGRLLVDMMALAEKIDFIQTDSVLEALLLEANLIKTHQPKYNTKEKDNKSYNYVVFTNEDFPKIFTVRGRTLLTSPQLSPQKGEGEKYKYIFGPFPHGTQLREALKIIRKIFPFSDNKCKPGRPCFNRQIGLCPGVCTGEISKAEYGDRIKNLKLFFEGKKKAVLINLERQMHAYAQKQEFEKAVSVRKTIFALNHIQDIALLKHDHKIDASAGGEVNSNEILTTFRIEAYDVAHISGKNVVGVMVVVEDDEVKKSDYRKFNIKINPGVNDTAALKEILRRRLGHLEWALPNLIVVDGGQAQFNAAETVLQERGFAIDIVSVVKNNKHKPKGIMGDERISEKNKQAIILANSEAHRFAITFHRKKRDKII
jgi:excinuclease ABC subunit C